MCGRPQRPAAKRGWMRSECFLVRRRARSMAICCSTRFGAELVYAQADKHETELVVQRVRDDSRAKGRKPYLIPVGGSTRLGVISYVLAMGELLEQLRGGRHCARRGGGNDGIMWDTLGSFGGDEILWRSDSRTRRDG